MLFVTIPKTMGFSNGMKLLDMLPTGYNRDYVNELFRTLGENGHDLSATFWTNLFFTISIFFKKLNKLKSPFTYLCLLPIIAGIVDYLENIGIITMLNNYPDLTETTVNATNTFSVIKSTSTSIFFIAVIVIFTILGIKFAKKK
jgi:hypothetical protein